MSIHFEEMRELQAQVDPRDLGQSGFQAMKPQETVELDEYALECNRHNPGKTAIKEVIDIPTNQKE